MSQHVQTRDTVATDPGTPDADRDERNSGGMISMSYGRFAAMIATSTVVMFGLTYLNTYELSHVWWSETRAWMALVMGSTMAVIMLGFMRSMYRSTAINIGIVVGSVIVFAGALGLVRSQATIDDRSWMKAMIPHHSIAILTSERAGIDDVRVRELADAIVIAQRREIKEMEWLIDDITTNGIAATTEDADQRPVPEFEGELNPGS